jgi:hypothetical protein
LSENASITGKPAVVLTENNEPDNESSTENRRPDVPSTVNTPDPLPRSTNEEDAFEDDITKEPVIFPAPIKGNPAPPPAFNAKDAVVAKDAVKLLIELPLTVIVPPAKVNEPVTVGEYSTIFVVLYKYYSIGDALYCIPSVSAFCNSVALACASSSVSNT